MRSGDRPTQFQRGVTLGYIFDFLASEEDTNAPSSVGSSPQVAAFGEQAG